MIFAQTVFHLNMYSIISQFGLISQVIKLFPLASTRHKTAINHLCCLAVGAVWPTNQQRLHIINSIIKPDSTNSQECLLSACVGSFYCSVSVWHIYHLDAVIPENETASDKWILLLMKLRGATDGSIHSSMHCFCSYSTLMTSMLWCSELIYCYSPSVLCLNLCTTSSNWYSKGLTVQTLASKAVCHFKVFIGRFANQTLQKNIRCVSA